MIEKIENSIRLHGLFRPGDRILVAISGGADSVALLHALHSLAPKLQFHVAAAHMNHKIRGDESNRDEQFVRSLARRLRIPVYCARTNVPELARKTGLSLEMAARQARYDALCRMAKTGNCSVVATAHTSDDQAETVLLKLCRGAGSRGLSGIPRKTAVSGLRLVRPILDMTRREIVEFLNSREEKWCDDSSNLDTRYLRNCVRHEILPMLEAKLNPDLRATLLRTADILDEEDAWLDLLSGKQLTASINKNGSLNLNSLRRAPVPAIRRVIRLWLCDRGVDAEFVDFGTVQRIAALALGSDGSATEPVQGGWLVTRSYDVLSVARLAHQKPAQFRTLFHVPGSAIMKDRGILITAAIRPGIARDRTDHPGELPAFASLSIRAAGQNLIIRSPRKGDRMNPLGMKGSRKLQDIFVDAKVPVSERMLIPVVECLGEIVWIPGYRIAEGWQVASPKAKAVQLRIEPRLSTC